ncbi:MAG: phosphoribosyl-ATP diphosphatase [Hyphomicrobiaceae bacterium]
MPDEDEIPPHVIDRLAGVIEARRTATSEASYTRSLLDKGPARCAKKFGEESIEFALAVVGEERGAVLDEAADVLYHLMVALASRDIAIDEVMARLEERLGTSGHAEKAARAPEVISKSGA